MRIALVGPDGAGKTSVAQALLQMIPQAALVYAGKSHNHWLPTTRWTYRLWQWLKQARLPLLPQLARFFLFYPAEFVENLVRFRRPGAGQIVIYDRHPIDRMIMVYEYQNSRSTPPGWFSQYPALRWYNCWYHRFFPAIEQVYCLLPEPALCWQRADGHYRNPTEAGWKIEAYRQAARQLAQRQPVQIIDITPAMTVNAIAQQILANIENQQPHD